MSNQQDTPPSPSPPKKKEEEEAPGNIRSDLGQDRNSVVTYHHSLTYSLTVSHSRNIMAASPITYEAVATIRSRMITCVSGYSPEITKGENLAMHRERMSNF